MVKEQNADPRTPVKKESQPLGPKVAKEKPSSKVHALKVEHAKAGGNGLNGDRKVQGKVVRGKGWKDDRIGHVKASKESSKLNSLSPSKTISKTKNKSPLSSKGGTGLSGASGNSANIPGRGLVKSGRSLPTKPERPKHGEPNSVKSKFRSEQSADRPKDDPTQDGEWDVLSSVAAEALVSFHSPAVDCARSDSGSQTLGKKIFKFPWDDKKTVEEAISRGRALLLRNVDPMLNSTDLEGVLEDALSLACDVRILPPHDTSCYKSAEAVVVFRKKEMADTALRTLVESILIISDDERPVLASKITNCKSRGNNFHGFFNAEKYNFKILDSDEMKNAVATSHCAQGNTVEYDMGLHWKTLQERSTQELHALERENKTNLAQIKAIHRKEE